MEINIKENKHIQININIWAGWKFPCAFMVQAQAEKTDSVNNACLLTVPFPMPMCCLHDEGAVIEPNMKEKLIHIFFDNTQ